MEKDSLIYGPPRHERYINPYTDFGFMKLFEQAEIARFTPQEAMEYEESIKVYRDLKNSMDTALRKGHEEGYAEGMEKGMEKGAYETNLSVARKMKELGLDTATIAEVTGLNEETIMTL